MNKLLYVVMIEKNNGAILRPIIFECAEDAQREAAEWKGICNVLDAWVCTVPLNKKQRKAA